MNERHNTAELLTLELFIIHVGSSTKMNPSLRHMMGPGKDGCLHTSLADC